MNLIKMQIPSVWMQKCSLYWYSLATIGVCVFCASASVGALFVLKRRWISISTKRTDFDSRQAIIKIRLGGFFPLRSAKRNISRRRKPTYRVLTYRTEGISCALRARGDRARTCLRQVATPSCRLTPPFSFGKPPELHFPTFGKYWLCPKCRSGASSFWSAVAKAEAFALVRGAASCSV